MSRRALVLGWTGFIGRHLVAALSAAGWDVAVPVVAARGHLPPGDGIVAIPVADLDTPGMERAVAGTGPEVVFNLAAAGVRPGAGPAELAAGNARLLDRLLAACRGGPALVVHTGSWSEYAPQPRALREDDPLGATTPYGAAKAEASTSGADRAAALGVDFVVMRLFNVYGPGEAPHRLLPFLVERLSHGEPVPLTPGDQERDFIHVSDVVAALIAAASPPIRAHGAYNVCTGIATSVAAFARLVAQALRAPEDLLAFSALPHRAAEPPRVLGDPSRLASTVGWRAAIPLAEGIPDSVRAIMRQPR